MTVPIIAFFNNKDGVGRTSLVYHLAWMYADLGMNVLAADLDPQSNLSAACLEEEQFERLWEGTERPTVFGFVQPLLRGLGDVSAQPQAEILDDRLALLPGDIQLSAFEDELSTQWTRCGDGDERAFRVTSAFWRVMQAAAAERDADVILVDLGPNLGAINRAVLISSDHVVVPLAPDLFSLQGLRNLGPKLGQWREQWQERYGKNPAPGLALPPGALRPAGYVVQQHSVRLDRPVQAYEKWMARIPRAYREDVLREASAAAPPPITEDPNCLALLKHYRSLVPMAQEAKKPMFHLKPADGAIGSHFNAVRAAGKDFETLARRIAGAVSLEVPPAVAATG